MPPRELTDDDVRRARAVAQLLHRPGRRPAVSDLVAGMLAVQAQDIGAAPQALRPRSRGLTAADVAAARQDRSVVRAWGPRGTLHLVAADDLAWLTALVLPASTNGALRRLAQEGVTGSPGELVRVTERALAGQGPLTKQRLGERLARLGCPAEGQGIVYLAFLAAIHGKLVLGPDRSNKPTYVHAADWLGRNLILQQDRDRALGELARRYLAAHSPAAPKDLAAWSGLSLRDANAGWAAIASELTELEHRGGPLWRPRRGWPKPTEPPLALLPAFDEYLLGWRDRRLIVADAHVRRVQPGGGIIHPTVVVDGRVVGTWRPARKPGGEPATIDLFEDVDAEALRAEANDVVRFTRTPEAPDAPDAPDA